MRQQQDIIRKETCQEGSKRGHRNTQFRATAKDATERFDGEDKEERGEWAALFDPSGGVDRPGLVTIEKYNGHRVAIQELDPRDEDGSKIGFL